MRLLTSLLPAGLITLVLFALMCYLIASGHRPLKPPVDRGFVDFIRMQQQDYTSDPARTIRSLPDYQQLPQSSPSVPQPAMTRAPAPQMPPLAMPMPSLPPPALDGKPYLDAMAPSPVRKPAPPVVSPPQVKPATKAAETPKIASAAPSIPKAAGQSGVPELTTGLGETGSLSRDAIPLLKIEPAYPRKAARAKKEGWVKVEFTITEEGQVLDPVVVKSRPGRVFNRSALAAIRKWRFQPKLVDGKPVTARATQVIEFKLAKR